MPIFQVDPDKLKELPETTFGAESITERKDIQRYLREQISVLDDRLMVVAEEFDDWLDSSRRIDLLCIDSDANLVVVELKRTDDGGHMELQALRYAAMISQMTFEQLAKTFAAFKSNAQPDIGAAQAEILKFLEWNEVYEGEFAQDTRIILAAADFSKELTTAVMWLNDRGIDIRCVRLKLYKMTDGRVLLDVQQLIPLPEASAFQTQIGEKNQATRQNLSDRHTLRLEFWESLLKQAKTKIAVHANRKPTTDNWISGSIGRNGFSLVYGVRQQDSQVELWIALGSGQTAKNLTAFKALEAQKADIEKEFGEPLDWQELPEREGCRIRYKIQGGYRSPKEEWPAIQTKLTDAMVGLDKSMRMRVANLNI